MRQVGTTAATQTSSTWELALNAGRLGNEFRDGCLSDWSRLDFWPPGVFLEERHQIRGEAARPPLAAWLPGWLPGCLAAWLPGCLAAWLPGCLAAWLPGCLAACLPACLPAVSIASSPQRAGSRVRLSTLLLYYNMISNRCTHLRSLPAQMRHSQRSVRLIAIWYF